MSVLSRILRAGFENSPRENLARVARKLSPAKSATANGSHTATVQPDSPPPETNYVVPQISDVPEFESLIPLRVRSSVQPIVLLGEKSETSLLQAAFEAQGRDAKSIEWTWENGSNIAPPDPDALIMLCAVAKTEPEWMTMHELKRAYGTRVVGIEELAMPYTPLMRALTILPYYKKSLSSLVPFYTGEKYFGPIDKLDAIFPLRDKTVIEFGPFDGCQTAGLVKAGARQVTCIEARADNFIKTLIARETFGWNNVRLVMDDMHNADATKYGQFDLAFAHGVYYHSVAPFLFLENLLSLSRHVFLGGFCATDILPARDYETLEYEGQTYRVKRYVEIDHFTAGVNPTAYYFHGDDLVRFFERKHCEITIISDEESQVTAGKFLRFLARQT